MVERGRRWCHVISVSGTSRLYSYQDVADKENQIPEADKREDQPVHYRQLGHERRFTFRYAGRDMRLTDVKGNVVKDVLA